GGPGGPVAGVFGRSGFLHFECNERAARRDPDGGRPMRAKAIVRLPRDVRDRAHFKRRVTHDWDWEVESGVRLIGAPDSPRAHAPEEGAMELDETDFEEEWDFGRSS